GVIFTFNSEIIEINKTDRGYILKTSHKEEILSEILINCAGLGSERVAKLAGLNTTSLNYKLYPCKGDYFSIRASGGKLKHLVYPVPLKQEYGLGIHATINLQGFIRLGPDANYVENIDYNVDEKKGKEFYVFASKYLPWLEEKDISPDMAGIRAKLQGPDDEFRDFLIKDEVDNGFPGLINLIGIESPGLTSCLAIAEYVSRIAKDKNH
ncbi:MAG: FAD-dependent oxidoreductase, partial [bacterium]